MITWNGQQLFLDLQDKIALAGILLYEDGEGWKCSNPTLAQEIIDAYTLEEAKQSVITKIIAHSKYLRDIKLDSVSPGEMASWYMKLSQARTWARTGLEADAPDLALEAAVRGSTLAELCEKVEANARILAFLDASIAGKEGYHKDKVSKLTSFYEVANYDYLAGWPSV